jgi:phosphoglycolate phosphatase
MDLIFDLDGTISDPLVGIARSINHALVALGYPPLPEDAVSPHIGVPLDIIFRRVVPGVSDEALDDLVLKYRKRYAEIGYAENVLYPGIADALERLAFEGVRMGLCTSKRKDLVEQILSLFSLRSYFAFVSGGDVGVEKKEQLRALLDEGTVSGTAVMIGDRAVDVLAARACGLSSIGVLWGYGSREELLKARADRLVRSPSALTELTVATVPGHR